MYEPARTKGGKSVDAFSIVFRILADGVAGQNGLQRVGYLRFLGDPNCGARISITLP
ncbi:hypothetical protein BKA23_3210 [Rudaeicoccus suwonensis]|uniref:Uncharacterized protein n=1 Tax=Rudaeicoccus suwonensis TaxID=657409 RepID=A0A561DWV7_9MICO|nr:hypothetical protein BKA23_3210 [Rudaeicoccus suwonensis]